MSEMSDGERRARYVCCNGIVESSRWIVAFCMSRGLDSPLVRLQAPEDPSPKRLDAFFMLPGGWLSKLGTGILRDLPGDPKQAWFLRYQGPDQESATPERIVTYFMPHSDPRDPAQPGWQTNIKITATPGSLGAATYSSGPGEDATHTSIIALNEVIWGSLPEVPFTYLTALGSLAEVLAQACGMQKRRTSF